MKFLGPYRVTRVKGNDRYEVAKAIRGEGPEITMSAADYMKPYTVCPSGTEDTAEWPNVGIGLPACRTKRATSPTSGE